MNLPMFSVNQFAVHSNGYYVAHTHTMTFSFFPPQERSVFYLFIERHAVFSQQVSYWSMVHLSSVSNTMSGIQYPINCQILIIYCSMWNRLAFCMMSMSVVLTQASVKTVSLWPVSICHSFINWHGFFSYHETNGCIKLKFSWKPKLLVELM